MPLTRLLLPVAGSLAALAATVVLVVAVWSPPRPRFILALLAGAAALLVWNVDVTYRAAQWTSLAGFP